MSHARGQAFLEQLPRLPHRLPYSPSLLAALFTQTGEASLASLEDIGRTIGQDQGLTARVLTLANSAYYGLQAEVTTPGRAVAVLGLCEVRTLVLAVGVAAMARERVPARLLDLAAYWRHQAVTAQAARLLARRLGLDSDALYTAAMLHDLGKLLAAMHRPGDWMAITSLEQNKGLPAFMAEDAHWGIDHALVGAMTLSSWNLPLAITDPVSWHHAPDLAPGHAAEAGALALADALAHHVDGPATPTGLDIAAALDRAGLDQGAIMAELLAAVQDPALEQLLRRLAV
ncbi:MAG: HDOD domain-containing protein [Thermodesulfobacteriota bacterium]